jgi:hypothetical protein
LRCRDVSPRTHKDVGADYLHHDDSDREGALCLHAVAAIELVLHNVTALGNVPWRTVVLMRRINRVWRGLHVKTVRPEDEESSM